MSAEITRIALSVRQARRSAFETHSKPLPYTVDRGLSSYENDLPTFQDRSFIDIVEKKLEEKNDGKQLIILDIGCGNGEFLDSCARRWPGRVRCIGITSEVYPNNRSAIIRLEKVNGGANEDDPLNSVEIIKGDALNMDSLVGQRKVDIAVALQSFKYFADPWMVLKRVYSALSEDGVCLIDSIRFNLKRIDGDVVDVVFDKAIMASYLRHVYDMETSSVGLSPVSFKKTLPQLSLPLRYSGKKETDELRIACGYEERYDVVEYELDREKAKRFPSFFSNKLGTKFVQNEVPSLTEGEILEILFG